MRFDDVESDTENQSVSPSSKPSLRVAAYCDRFARAEARALYARAQAPYQYRRLIET